MNMGDYYEWYEPAVPKNVKGGIKAQSRRGSFTSSWWAGRWIKTLESFDIGARLARGKSYARKGQVARLDIGRGRVIAEVQGTRSDPYIVSVKLDTLSDSQWDKIISRLLEKPIFAAQLLGNEMPREIEAVFEDEGISLFPAKQRDLETNCTCPDWSNPCKHIAAVFYIMGEAFDNDPFLIFKLRGMDRKEIIGRLTQKKENGNTEREKILPEALPESYSSFWDCSQDFNMALNINPPRLHAAIPKRLGLIPFWRSSKDFIGSMEKIYKCASGYAQKIFEKPGGDEN